VCGHEDWSSEFEVDNLLVFTYLFQTMVFMGNCVTVAKSLLSVYSSTARGMAGVCRPNEYNCN